MEDDKEIISLPVLWERQKVANHRIDDLEKNVKELTDFKFTVNALKETVADLKITVNKMNGRDGDTFRKLKFSTSEKIILLIIGMLFFYLFNFK